MISSKRQPKWDMYEAVVLLDGYLEVLHTNKPKARTVRRVSADLRRMAVNRNIGIDNSYRNENGISYQIQSMDSAYKGEKIYISATRLFEEVVDMYRTDTERYFEILKEAKNMIVGKQTNKEFFLAWVASVLSPHRCKWIEETILKMEQFTVTSKLISCSIFDDMDRGILEAVYKASKKNKFSQVKNRKPIKNTNDDLKTYMEHCSQLSKQEKLVVKTESLVAETPAESVGVVASLNDNNNGKIPASADVNSEIVAVLKQHYKYGFKYASIIEFLRFRQFADAMGINLPEEDGSLKSYIVSSGIVIGDKVYCKDDDMLRELQCIVDDIFSSGADVIYYESMFENKQEWMEFNLITSPDMLKKYLQKTIAGCFFSKNFMAKGSRRSVKEVVTDELKRVWGARPLESVYSLHDRLPYIPLSNIWRVISGNDFFVWASGGEYLFIDRFRITEKEEEDILEFVDRAFEENGFATLGDIPLGDIEEENYELTRFTIYNAIYKKTLSGKYHLNGKILSKEESELDCVTLLKSYISDKNECTFDETLDKVVELTGGKDRQYAFQALYDDMVRVDRNRFVAKRFVTFSIDEIDILLSKFITDKFGAIRDLSTFAMFPLCGQTWNHYLLESFCYKYSRKYSLHVIHFNDNNVGIIAEKDFNKKYNEMLAIALARADVELLPEVVGQYLFNTGYMAKSKYARLGDITQSASRLRKERL